MKAVIFGLIALAVGKAALPTDALAQASLSARYAKLACAVVQLRTNDEVGTGFFINSEGDIASAAHVVYDRSYTTGPLGLEPHVTVKVGLRVVQPGLQDIAVPPQTIIPNDLLNANHDLAIIKTGNPTKCFLQQDDSDKVRVGDDVISIGFPASSTDRVLYRGFLSSKHILNHLLGPITDNPGRNAKNMYEVMRVQMPITPGVSGSPLIDDSDRMIGIMVEEPVVFAQDVEDLIKAYGFDNSGKPVALEFGFNTLSILGHLAFAVKTFDTAGAGYAVPINLLR